MACKDRGKMTEEAACPCGSGHNFAGCCGPYLEQGQLPATAEALMRSRYSAFALGNVAYLKSSWHPSTAPKELSLHTTPSWCGLEIVATSAGGKDDQEGTVEFKAHYLSQGRLGILHEKSRFVKEKGRWYYASGDLQDPEPQEAKVGRNDPCPCGSGKKFKKCCMK